MSYTTLPFKSPNHRPEQSLRECYPGRIITNPLLFYVRRIKLSYLGQAVFHDVLKLGPPNWRTYMNVSKGNLPLS